jgi:hypothetical protein
MKKIIFGLCLIGGISAHADTRVNDSVTYSESTPGGTCTETKTITDLNQATGEFKYSWVECGSKGDDGHGYNYGNFMKENLLDNCDPQDGFFPTISAKGTKEAITTSAGTFTDACHYIFTKSDGTTKVDAFFAKIPFQLIKWVEVKDGKTQKTELMSYTRP